jgi:CheY-like chemotaxis protein
MLIEKATSDVDILHEHHNQQINGESPVGDRSLRRGAAMATSNLQKLTDAARENGHPFRILIVDDEPWVQEVFRDFCELTDAFEVDLASSGHEAIRLVGDHQYDLITMDLIMPEMSGLDALTRIKEIQPRVPVMVITGNATDKLINEAGVLGACRVMYKPVQLDEFVNELTSTLG